MTAPADTLTLLAERARDGDRGALDRLLREVWPDVLRGCGRFLSHVEDAEEAAQDVLLIIAERIGGFEGRSSFRTWLYAVMANSCRQKYRALQRHAAERIPLERHDQVPDPRRTSLTAGSRVDLLDALDQLERRTRNLAQALVLRDFCGLGYREIAEHLNVPVSTVRSRIHDARVIMRTLLREERAAAPLTR
ncbi:RNA polymerase sigma factor [Amycolatopsis sp. NBC_01307]|uniref:RNA polymerase sigma factor n=1 Tax=Amycolatopsis sp. NBC_01307 TaxID=2903561 RepID=UPI002E15DB13|nr:RNA polymerase sigma factor [Amycolatopsis sp. NBC_01307]